MLEFRATSAGTGCRDMKINFTKHRFLLGLGFPLALGMHSLLWRVGYGRPQSGHHRHFIPAQTLHFRDDAGINFASLSLATDGNVILSLEKAAAFSDGGTSVPHPYLSLYGSNGHGAVTVRPYSTDDSFIDILTPGGESYALKNMGPTGKKAPAADDLVPSEDVELVDKKGHAFALLGLSEPGNPAMVLFGPDGRIVAFWQLFERSWQAIELFDLSGAPRFAAEYRPGRSPTLTIFEKPDSHLGSYTLDPRTYQEVPAKNPLFSVADPSQELTWLSPTGTGLSAPIALFDNRGQKVWHGP
jgi:hypothetical protein